MATRPAARKKQAGRLQTIEQALSAQSGKLWYGPKAQPHPAQIWLRKAFDSVYAPFLFRTPVSIDQRCNYVAPTSPVDWESLAAVLSSSLFALALESLGAASLGAGALEIPTEKLRDIPVLDIRLLAPAERKELCRLAEEAWQHEQPVDWRHQDSPGPCLQRLDEWLLKKMGTRVTAAGLYRDLADVCRARLRIAADKQITAKKVVRQDIDAVAETIVASLRPLLEGKRFPEAFCRPGRALMHLDFSRHAILTVKCEPMMTDAVVMVRDGETGRVILSQQYPREVGEVILKALLMGRRDFDTPTDRLAAAEALYELGRWLPVVMAKIEEGCQASALGTRFEEGVRSGAMQKLGLHPKISTTEVFGEYTLRE